MCLHFLVLALFVPPRFKISLALSEDSQVHQRSAPKLTCIREQEWSEPSIDTLLASLDKCNTPALVYCKTGARAVALGVAHTATRSRFHEGKLIHEGTNLSAVQKQLLDTICGGVEDCQMKKVCCRLALVLHKRGGVALQHLYLGCVSTFCIYLRQE